MEMLEIAEMTEMAVRRNVRFGLWDWTEITTNQLVCCLKT